MDNKVLELFEGVELSEAAKEGIVALFETSVDAKVEDKTQGLEESIEAKYKTHAEEYAEYVLAEMEEKTQKYIKEEVMPAVDKYLTYAAKEYVSENEVAIESTTKVKLAESFLTGVKAVTESFNVEVPEGQDDVVTEMQKQLDSMEKRFEDQLDESAKLETEIVAYKRAGIVNALAEDLTESQKEKFFTAVEKVEFIDESQYTESAKHIFTSYFPTEDNAGTVTETVITPVEEIVEDETNKNSYLDNLLKQI